MTQRKRYVFQWKTVTAPQPPQTKRERTREEGDMKYISPHRTTEINWMSSLAPLTAHTQSKLKD